MWLSFLIYSVLVGNHDAHAKNVSIVHDFDGPRIADFYDAVPILQISDAPSMIGSKKINGEVSSAIGQEFDHHSITLDHFRHEAATWGAMSESTVNAIIQATLNRFSLALDAVDEVPGASPTLRDRLGYNIDRIGSSKAIGTPKLPPGPGNRIEVPAISWSHPERKGECQSIRPSTNSGLEVPVVVFGNDGLADHVRRSRAREEVVVLVAVR
ncbi:HipA domain-containing protein [Cryobacterium sp. Y11]|uniref:HipA domain-containing protein n=1 Tax=Cryobacterium sp. Y11 TaxID=2045016 RepID=UPI003515B993